MGVAEKLTGWRVETLDSIHGISAGEWDRCVGADDVLVSHRHLAALEDSGVAVPENGFTPCHVVLRDADGLLAAAAPAYLKTHSLGEIGVDMGLRLAHERMVGPYYPKVQVEVPMTPIAGSRLLVRPGVDRPRAVSALAGALQEMAVERAASSVQIAYLASGHGDPEILREMQMATSENNTFRWRCGDDTSFSTFLGGMTSRRRHMIKQERRQVRSRGLGFRYFRGRDVRPEMASRVFDLYQSTYDRHTTEPDLNKAYFRNVFETMPELVDLSASTDGDSWTGVLLSLNGRTRGHALYWGQAQDIRYLHFEQADYRSIERAFVTGLDMLDFGGTGAHKAPRGLRPEAVAHAMWFRDAGMRDVAIAACKRKTAFAETEREAETARLPFAPGSEGRPG